MNTIKNKFPLLAILLVVFLAACKKEFDAPPVRELPVGNILSIQELRDKFQGENITFEEDYSMFGVITMDDKSGNIYRNAFIEDGTAAINLRLNTAGGVYQGDSVRVYLKGVTLAAYNGMLQLDGVDVDFNVIKQATKISKQPTTLNISQINSGNYQSRLVRIENVEFAASELGQTYANAVTQQTLNRTLTDCNNNTVIVRTSGFADFANQTVAEGNGALVAVVSEFNGTIQLYIRSIEEVQMTADRCTGGGGSGNQTICQPLTFDYFEDFSSISNNVDINIQCWNNVATEGNRVWRGREFNNVEKYAQATAHMSTDANNVAYLISPTMAYSGNNILTFKSAKANLDNPSQELSVWISTDYDGTNITTANWNKITSANIANSTHANNAWINSGNVNVSDYVPSGHSGHFFVAFRYEGNASQNKTASFRIDDVNITY